MVTELAQEHPKFPQNWQIAPDYDPNDHLMNLKGRDYLNVQNRLLWFIRDQRAFIASGIARVPYVIRTELVEMNHTEGWAQFCTYVRDVLGNESTMYGSEAAKDFADYAEKASTKSLGRALLNLGYGTAFAPEMDEGERVVDAAQERRRQPAQANRPVQSPQRPTPPQATAAPPATREPAPSNVTEMDSAAASALNQQSLADALRTDGYGGVNSANTFLEQVLGRQMNILQVAGGTSDISIGEVRKVITALAKGNQQRANDVTSPEEKI